MLQIRGTRVVLQDGIRPATIVVDAGRIASIDGVNARATGVPLLDAGDLVVLPGLVDTHVHVNEPGRTDWEGFETATDAAAAGGVTTLVDMPLNSIPATTSTAGLEAKRRTAEGKCRVDVGFWGGVVPGNTPELEPLARAGVLGFKCFLSPSGVDGFAHVAEGDLREALAVLGRLGLPLLVHAEMPARLRSARPDGDVRVYGTWLDTRPPEAEHEAIHLLLALAREFEAHVHVVHLASAGALAAIRSARAEGVPLTIETCPHYLFFCAEEIAKGATAFKCAPPIREGEHREALWKALVRHEIDLVASDHSPAPPAMKHLNDGDFVAAWGGIASLEVGLPVMWTAAAQRGLGIDRLVEWMCAAPARLAGLSSRKGRIAAGCDADLVFFDPDAEWVIDPAALHHRHPVTPYAWVRVCGRIERTILRGEVIFDGGRFPARRTGKIIERHAE